MGQDRPMTDRSSLSGHPDARPSGAVGVLMQHRYALLAVVLTLLYCCGLNSLWRMHPDGALYLGLGRSLAQQGEYVFNHSPHTFVLPGFPVMLACVFRLFGENYLAFNVMISLFGLGCVWGAYLLFREQSAPAPLLWVCLIFVSFSRTLYYYSAQILADVPFTFFCLMALVCGLKMLRTGGRASWLWFGAGALLWLAATTIRPFGPAAAMAFVAALWLRKDGIKEWRSNAARTLILAVLFACLAVPWVLRTARLQRELGPTVSYLGAFVVQRGVWRLACRFVPGVYNVIHGLSDALFGTDVGFTFGLICWALIILGAARHVRKGDRLLGAYALIYVPSTFLGGAGRRHLLPVLPLLYYWLAAGAIIVGSWLGRRVRFFAPERRRRVMGYVCIGLVLLPNLLRIGKVIYTNRSPRFYEVTDGGEPAMYREAAVWLTENVKDGGAVLVSEDRYIHYLTRMRTLHLTRFTRAEALAKLLERMKEEDVRYILSHPEHDHSPELIAALKKQAGDACRVLKDWEEMELLEVDPERL